MAPFAKKISPPVPGELICNLYIIAKLLGSCQILKNHRSQKHWLWWCRTAWFQGSGLYSSTMFRLTYVSLRTVLTVHSIMSGIFIPAAFICLSARFRYTESLVIGRATFVEDIFSVHPLQLDKLSAKYNFSASTILR